MSQSFSDFELALTALHLDPEAVRSGNEARRLSALERAYAFLFQVKKTRKVLAEEGYVEAVERTIARDLDERERAASGELTESYVKVPSKEFNGLLSEANAHPKLLKIKLKGHLDRLRRLKFDFHPLKGAAQGRDRFRGGAIILKDFAIRYAKTESERMRKKDTQNQQKSRAVKKNTH
jgi:hypothetical protein